MNATIEPPPLHGRRLVWPAVFTVLPALPVIGVAVQTLRSPDSWGLLLHPLGAVFVAVGLLLAVFPVRLAFYTCSLRERSPTKKKIWAAVQCAVPGSAVCYIVMIIADQGFSVGRALWLGFLGSYLLAFVFLVVEVVRDLGSARKAKAAEPIPSA